MGEHRIVMEAPAGGTAVTLTATEARNLAPEDMPEIADLMWAAYRDGGQTVEETVRRELREFAEGQYGTVLWDCSFVALDGGKPVAAVLTCDERGKALIINVFTHPAWRNRGLATGLILMAKAAARDAGYSAVRVKVRTDNAPALHIDKKLGFCPV